MNFTKDLIGKHIYGRPTGNNAARGRDIKDQRLVTFEVVSIGRVYVALRHVGSKRTCKYDMKSGATESAVRSGHSLNAGYVFYADMSEYEAHLQTIGKLRDIESFFRDWGWRDKLSKEAIDEIHDCFLRNGLIEKEKA